MTIATPADIRVGSCFILEKPNFRSLRTGTVGGDDDCQLIYNLGIIDAYDRSPYQIHIQIILPISQTVAEILLIELAVVVRRSPLAGQSAVCVAGFSFGQRSCVSPKNVSRQALSSSNVPVTVQRVSVFFRPILSFTLSYIQFL